jgi:hypothetical protein
VLRCRFMYGKREEVGVECVGSSLGSTRGVRVVACAYCVGGLQGFSRGEAVVYGSGLFHENRVEEVYGGRDVGACALESLDMGCGFEYEFSASSA